MSADTRKRSFVVIVVIQEKRTSYTHIILNTHPQSVLGLPQAPNANSLAWGV